MFLSRLLHPFFSRRSLIAAIAFGAIALVGDVTLAAEPDASFFDRKIKPILVGRCLECHADDRKGGLDLTSKAGMAAGGDSGKAVLPGKPDDSLLLQYVESGEMPPKHPLPRQEIAALRTWIQGGADFPDVKLNIFSITTEHRAGYDWWSLQPVERPPLPTVSAAHRVRARSPIDRFVMARLEKAGLGMSPPADRATYLRRVAYDLTGLLPTYAEIQAFAGDSRPDAYERVVDRLLASPHYGERWGRHWLDVVRFAESNGFERDRIRTNFWPYRDYVVRSLNRDKPYDQFVREQLAGDAINPDDAEHLIATGFLVAGPKNDVPTVSELEQLQTRQDELDEYVVATGATFLGLTLGCARCHDHKFDPVDRRDYYSLTAVFSGLDRGAVVIAGTREKARRAAEVARIKQHAAEKKAESDTLLARVRQRVLSQRKPPADGTPLMSPVVFTRNVDAFNPVTARFVRFIVTATSNQAQPCLDELEVYGADEKRNLALASVGAKASSSTLLPGYKIHQVGHLNDGLYGNSHSWISNEPGRGWAQIEFAAPAAIQRVVWGRDRDGKYKDRLPTGYRIETSLDGQTWRQVGSSENRKPFDSKQPGTTVPQDELLAALTAKERAIYDRLTRGAKAAEAELAALPPLPSSYAAVDHPPAPAFVLRRGDVRSRGREVRPAALHAIRKLSVSLSPKGEDTGPERRRLLAEWITSPDNPLTARVFVNRLWHHHFGGGIVGTPSDFGFKGDRPSHPRLLDWLAADFVEHGWRVKRLHRMIVLSETYRQSATHRAKAAAMDGANRLLWRANRRRLDAESLRDAILAVAGNLDRTMGGPGFRVFRYRDGNVPDYVLLDEFGPETWRRSLYRFNIRSFQAPLMSVFDCPDASVQTPDRASSTTALQALSLMNNPFVFEQARQFASRVERLADDDPQVQATQAYRLALGRDPTGQERRDAAAFIRRQGLFAFCRVLLNTNEFLYVF